MNIWWWLFFSSSATFLFSLHAISFYTILSSWGSLILLIYNPPYQLNYKALNKQILFLQTFVDFFSPHQKTSLTKYHIYYITVAVFRLLGNKVLDIIKRLALDKMVYFKKNIIPAIAQEQTVLLYLGISLCVLSSVRLTQDCTL